MVLSTIFYFVFKSWEISKGVTKLNMTEKVIKRICCDNIIWLVFIS